MKEYIERVEDVDRERMQEMISFVNTWYDEENNEFKHRVDFVNTLDGIECRTEGKVVFSVDRDFFYELTKRICDLWLSMWENGVDENDQKD